MKSSGDKSGGMSWARFVAMIATSTVLMIPLMYQLVYVPEHLEFSINRLVASLVMGAVMAVVMLLFMWKMYEGRKTKIAVLVSAIVVGGVLFYVNRAQSLIDDVNFMRAMIPHHSIAINNAEKARISDPRVRDLADQIIEAQVREIEEMKLLIADITKNGKRDDQPLAPVPAVVTPNMQSRIDEAVQ